MGAVLSPFTGGRVAIVDQHITTGNITCPNTGGVLWTIITKPDTTRLELDLPAAVGNRVQLGVTGMRTGSDSIDVAVVVGTTQVRYLSTGTVTPASDGDVGWYAAGGGPFFLNNSPRGFVVTAGDLDGGNVRFCMVSNGSGLSIIEAATTDPFYWCAMNYG
jgi:hypothetical protein